MANIEGINAILPELETALDDHDPKARISTIEILGHHKNTEGLSLLTRALSDNASDVRAKAIEAIQKYESESSIRWLLRAFKDPSADVRIAVANCFAFFFREEEAIVHRKYLGGSTACTHARGILIQGCKLLLPGP